MIRVVLWAAWAVSVGIELVAVMLIFVGVEHLMIVEIPMENFRGEILIAIGSGLAVFGAFLFAKIFLSLRKEYNSTKV